MPWFTSFPILPTLCARMLVHPRLHPANVKDFKVSLASAPAPCPRCKLELFVCTLPVGWWSYHTQASDLSLFGCRADKEVLADGVTSPKQKVCRGMESPLIQWAFQRNHFTDLDILRQDGVRWDYQRFSLILELDLIAWSWTLHTVLDGAVYGHISKDTGEIPGCRSLSKDCWCVAQSFCVCSDSMDVWCSSFMLKLHA